jgi:hypothetical protein
MQGNFKIFHEFSQYRLSFILKAYKKLGFKIQKKRARESLESNCKWLSGNTRVRQSGT